jgi:hypothetical protein
LLSSVEFKEVPSDQGYKVRAKTCGSRPVQPAQATRKNSVREATEPGQTRTTSREFLFSSQLRDQPDALGG